MKLNISKLTKGLWMGMGNLLLVLICLLVGIEIANQIGPENLIDRIRSWMNASAILVVFSTAGLYYAFGGKKDA